MEDQRLRLIEQALATAETALQVATIVLMRGDADCPTCPYLDSLEEEEFCECGAGECELEEEIAYRWSDAAFPTQIIFCKN